jgi:hypothetical protein
VKIVPIIRDGKIVMDDINEQYPVTNVMWRYMDSMTLGEYLGSLGVDYKSYGFIKSFPRSFYLRIGFYETGYVITTNSHLYDSHLYDSLVTVRDNDPWHRKFKVFPVGSNLYGNDVYYYFSLMAKGLSSYGSGIYNCYVHVTTVSGKPVYCVDVLN